MFVVVILALLFFAANAGKVLVVDAPQSSDLILVLAGETDTRPTLALRLLNEGYARRVLLDVPADARIFDTTAIQIAQAYVQRLPEASRVTICPIPGLSTKQEAHDVARCLEHENGSRILIVTSDYHTRRALSIFRHEIPAKSFSVAAAHDARQFGIRWWTNRQWAKMCLDEWLRTLWWNLIERWH
ncbi:MAG TPA: YdcF family protein [Candidatus Sulfotelmatobacter sp.]|nr:YdcF family protein [Candidatus Sulfotelmatobacter sp.]